MDLRDMRHFLAVAEEGHIGRAAARLHLSQPPLTRHIQALEEKIGVALFVRSPKGMTLTDAGRTLLQETPNLLALAQQALERTRLAGQGLIGRLDVGLFGSGVLDVIPRILARFHQAHPEVKVVLHNLTKDAQLQALRARRITVASSRADTTTTGNCGCNARKCTSALKPCAPGMFRSINTRSASGCCSASAYSASSLSASSKVTPGITRGTAPRSASRNSGWSSAIRRVGMGR